MTKAQLIDKSTDIAAWAIAGCVVGLIWVCWGMWAFLHFKLAKERDR